MIHLIKNYYAAPNNMGFTLLKKKSRKDKEGNPVYETMGYCGNFTVYLCPRHHRTGPAAVHADQKTNLIVKRYAQAIWEQNHTREEFREKFRMSYL